MGEETEGRRHPIFDLPIETAIEHDTEAGGHVESTRGGVTPKSRYDDSLNAVQGNAFETRVPFSKPVEESAQNEAPDQGTSSEGNAPPNTGVPKADGDGVTEPPTEGDGKPADAPPSELDAKFLKDGKLNIGALEAEYAESFKDGKGDLTPATYKWLNDRGIPEDTARDYIAYRKNQADALSNRYTDLLGGPAIREGVMEWGRANYTEGQRESFNKAIQSNDPGLIEMALERLKSAYDKANPPATPVRTVQGDPSASAPVPGYRSEGDWMADKRDPRYRKDPRFRASVDRKLAQSVWAMGR